jgi:hypothetical protein
MNKLTIKFNNGTEATYKTPFTRDKIEGTVISNCPYTLFLRHSDKNPKAKAMLDNNKYLDHNKDSVLAYFGATITSFENVPLTCEHPYENVTPENYKEYSVGYVRDVHRGTYNGKDVLIGTLVVTDPKCIQDIQNGYRTELSCGYDCDITDGDNPQQINIRGNHYILTIIF